MHTFFCQQLAAKSEEGIDICHVLLPLPFLYVIWLRGQRVSALCKYSRGPCRSSVDDAMDLQLSVLTPGNIVTN